VTNPTIFEKVWSRITEERQIQFINRAVCKAPASELDDYPSFFGSAYDNGNKTSLSKMPAFLGRGYGEADNDEDEQLEKLEKCFRMRKSKDQLIHKEKLITPISNNKRRTKRKADTEENDDKSSTESMEEI